MIRTLINKIYQKRTSDNILFKALFAVKDYMWEYVLPESVIQKVSGLADESKSNISVNEYTDLNLCRPVKKYAFVFVCQAGKLEKGSVLLAASLKRHLKCE